MAHRDSLIYVSLRDLSEEIESPISSPSKLDEYFSGKYPDQVIHIFFEEVDGEVFTLHEVNPFNVQIMQSSYQNANITIIPQ